QRESDARRHRERGRGHEQRIRGRGEPGGRPGGGGEEQRDRRDLQDGLGLAIHAGAEGVRGASPDLSGDELAREDEDERPGRREPPYGQSGKRADDEDLVREWIQSGAERRRSATPRERSVERIRGGGPEKNEKRELGVARGDETDHRDDKKAAGRAERVRERHWATKTRSTTSP